MTCRQGKKTVEIIPEEAQILHLLDRDCESVILNMFKQLKVTIFKGLKEVINMMSQQIEILIQGNYF